MPNIYNLPFGTSIIFHAKRPNVLVFMLGREGLYVLTCRLSCLNMKMKRKGGGGGGVENGLFLP